MARRQPGRSPSPHSPAEAHCYAADHEDKGMMGVIEVVAP